MDTVPEWKKIVAFVRDRHPNILRTWFDELRAVGLDGGILNVQCANLPQQRYLQEHASRPFVEAAQSMTGMLLAVRFTIGNHTAIASPGDRFPTPSESQPHEKRSLRSDGWADQLPLNPDYTFESFITGPSNRLAHAASVAVGENPGKTYNPLFLHGRVGLGKTHLLQAIAHRVLANQEAPTIVYLSCEQFINHFIESVERGSLHDFRNRYRQVDVLLIDDMQFMANRERSQEEFFHTFNTLYQSGKQLILTADSPPGEIPSLEERLTSRFGWGLVARLDPPCMETRQAILRAKARRRGIDLPEDVASYVASLKDGNIRELEGAITTIDAYSQQLGRAIDLPLVREALGQEPQAAESVSIPRILEVVTQHYNVKKSDLRGKRRHKSIAFPRQVCMFLARELTTHSLDEIGSYFGGRDHTTVIHATRLVQRLMTKDQNLMTTLEELKSRVTDGSSVRL